jgi:hypothetical protein
LLRPQPKEQPGRVVLPPPLDARFQFGDGSLRYRLYSEISGNSEIAFQTFSVFPSRAFTMLLPWYGRFELRLGLGMEGDDISVTFGDSISAAGTDTVLLAPPLVPFEVVPMLRGAPVLTTLGSIRVATERGDGTRVETQASAPPGLPALVWGVAGVAEVSYYPESNAPYFPGRVYATVEADSVVPFELGRFLVTLRLVTTDGAPAPAIPIQVWRYSPSDYQVFTSDPSGTASLFANGGTYKFELSVVPPVVAGAEIFSDTTLTFTVPSAGR